MPARRIAMEAAAADCTDPYSKGWPLPLLPTISLVGAVPPSSVKGRVQTWRRWIRKRVCSRVLGRPGS